LVGYLRQGSEKPPSSEFFWQDILGVFVKVNYMPEGPSIVILKQEVKAFKGKKVLEATGTSKLDYERINGAKVVDFKSWGKHFLICFKGFTIRIHMLLFGTYRINEKREAKPRLSLTFPNGELNFYASAVKVIEGDINDVYDWSVDVMSDEWSAPEAKKKLKKKPNELVADVLLDQDMFAGVGNIIKNEVLFRIKVHPESVVGKLPLTKLNAMVKEARNYSFDFLGWKQEYKLKKHLLAHSKTTCPRCLIPYTKKVLGKAKRRAFYCNNCQVKYS
jgi:endonuclease-8